MKEQLADWVITIVTSIAIFLKDGSKDSLKLDQPVSSTRSFWIKDAPNKLVIEEPGRVVVFNQFGYREHEALKPLSAKKLVNVEKKGGLYFVFFR